MRSCRFGLVLGLIGLGAAYAAEKPAPDPKAAVAIVDGEEISRADLDAFVRENVPREPASPAERARVEAQALDGLIARKLLQGFIEKQKVEIDPELLFQAKLYSYLQAHVEGPKSDEEALALATRLKKEIDGGADFAELARKHSICGSAREGGDLGDFAPAQMVPAFSEAAGALKVGGTGGPVKTQFGYHVIQRLALDDAAGEARGMLHARHILVQTVNPKDPRAVQGVLGRLLDDLRGKAKIENRLAPAKAGEEPVEEEAVE